MPMYEYGCLECDRRFDRLRRMEEADSGVTCPHCASEHVQRRLSTFAAHTRGGATGAEPVAAKAPSGGGCCGGSCGCGSAARN